MEKRPKLSDIELCACAIAIILAYGYAADDRGIEKAHNEGLLTQEQYEAACNIYKNDPKTWGILIHKVKYHTCVCC